MLTTGVDGINESVCVFAAYTVNKLSVGPFSRAVETSQTWDTASGTSCRFGQSLAALKE